MLRKRKTHILANIFLMAVMVLMLYPLLQIVNIALKTNQEFLSEPNQIVRNPQWGNFIEAWQSAEMGIYFFNSFIYAFLVAIGVVIIASMAAFPISRAHVKGSNVLYILFLSALFLPGGLVPLLFLMKYFGFMNTYHGFIIMKIGGGLSVAIFIFYGFVKGIPRELDEAAAMDGCGYFRYVFTIVMPLMKPAIMTVGMLIVIAVWNDFIGPYIFLTDKEYRPLTAGLYMFMGQYSVNWTILAAGILIVATPLIVTFALLQKYIISGITSGSVKG